MDGSQPLLGANFNHSCGVIPFIISFRRKRQGAQFKRDQSRGCRFFAVMNSGDVAQTGHV